MIITQGIIDNCESNKYSIKVDGVPSFVGQTFTDGAVLVVTADFGYRFYPDNYYWPVKDSLWLSGRNPSSGEFVYVGFDFDEFKKVGTKVFVSVVDGAGLNKINGLTEQFDEVEDVVSGTNNIYLISSENLTEINAERFVQTADSVFDYGVYILSVLELPFSIPVEIIYDDEETVKLASKDTGVLVNKLKTDEIRIDLGEIYTPALKGNFLDLKNTVAMLHLPRTSSILVDVEYVVGQTIKIDYIIDCYTGVATINIFSSKIGGVIHTQQTDLGVNIPYVASGVAPNLRNDNITVGGDNGVLTPFIELIKNEAILPNGFFTIPIIDEDFIYNQNGFIRIEEIDLVCGATTVERERIVAILKKGIIVGEYEGELYLDYVKGEYLKDGKKSTLVKIGGFERSSKAWEFVDGSFVEFGENESRISSKGLLLEPEATNEFTWSINQNGANSFPTKNGNYVIERSDLHDGYYGELLVQDEITGYFYKRSGSDQVDATVSYILSKSNGSEDIVVGSSSPSYDGRVTGSEASSSTLLGFGYIKIAGLEDRTANAYRGILRYPDQVGRDGNVRIHAMQKELGTVATSLIITEGTPVTRAPEIQYFNVPKGKTLTFDGDDGLVVVMVTPTLAKLTANKPARLRKVKVI